MLMEFEGKGLEREEHSIGDKCESISRREMNSFWFPLTLNQKHILVVTSQMQVTRLKEPKLITGKS